MHEFDDAEIVRSLVVKNYKQGNLTGSEGKNERRRASAHPLGVAASNRERMSRSKLRPPHRKYA